MMINFLFIGFGITLGSLYYLFHKISKHCNSGVLPIENNTQDTEIPPSYEEAVQNRE